MNKKSSLENLMNNHLQGLIIPEKNVAISYVVWLLIAFLLLVVIFGFWKWLQYRKQSKQKALRKIRLLQQNSSKQSPKYIAAELANILRKGLKVKQLSLFNSEDEKHWKEFIKELNLACYSTEEINESEVQSLIHQGRSWLVNS